MVVCWLVGMFVWEHKIYFNGSYTEIDTEHFLIVSINFFFLFCFSSSIIFKIKSCWYVHMKLTSQTMHASQQSPSKIYNFKRNCFIFYSVSFAVDVNWTWYFRPPQMIFIMQFPCSRQINLWKKSIVSERNRKEIKFLTWSII